MSAAPVVVVGAGIAGLSCARALAAAGRAVVVLERARGVGGRCATRRLDGQPLDFGAPFLHGRDPELLALAGEVEGGLAGWPRAVEGSGRPCHPRTFSPGEHRLAFAGGMSAFPKRLARGLDVRLEARVVAVEPAAGEVVLRLERGEPLRARTAVLALAAEQQEALLAPLEGAAEDARAARALLGLSRTHAVLVVMALYDGVPPPAWDLALPEESRILQVAVHDSAKRGPGAALGPRLGMVWQAHSPWSRMHLDDPGWPAALLDEAARLFGPWAARPARTEPHRWRWARNDLAAELAAPMLLALPGGARLGLAGDRFAPGGGVEAAFRSGAMLAGRILAEEDG